jgi:hypothetical protein
MTRAFGPVVTVNPSTHAVEKVSCSWCIFRSAAHDAGYYCSHMRGPRRKIPDIEATPDWCEMKAGSIRDAVDMSRGTHHYVMRWSGRRTDQPREVYCGIPSEAARAFRLISRSAKRGTVRLEDNLGNLIDAWPSPVTAS